jgi:hypothetical protein
MTFWRSFLENHLRRVDVRSDRTCALGCDLVVTIKNREQRIHVLFPSSLRGAYIDACEWSGESEL